MNFWLLLVAGILSAFWLLVHLTAGERDVAKPLLQSGDLDPVVRETQYLCWHFTSVTMACMAGFYVWSAITTDTAFAIAGIALSSSFAVLGIGLVVLRKGKHLELPQGWLFVPVTLLGLGGLFL